MRKLIFAFALSLFLTISQIPASFAVCDPPLPGDTNHDCKVALVDDALMAGNWLAVEALVPGVIEQWTARKQDELDRHGIDDEARDIAVDADGNVYVTGIRYNEEGEYDLDYLTVKYDADGNEVWAAGYDGYTSNGLELAEVVAVDSAGNSYVTGYGGPDVNLIGDYDYLTIKYNADGNQAWVARYDGDAHGRDFAYGLVVDDDGNVYVTGESTGVEGTKDYATVKYDPNGNQLWAARFDATSLTDQSHSYWQARDDANNLYMFDAIVDPCYVDYWYLYTKYRHEINKYSYKGLPLWKTEYEGPDDETGFRANDWDLDGPGNIYVTGYQAADVNSFDANYDYVTCKYNADGNQVWVASYNGDGNDLDFAHGVASDSQGNVYVTGDSIGTDGFEDFATVKYDADGNEVWVVRYDMEDGAGAFGHAVAVDSNDNIYVMGEGYGRVYVTGSSYGHGWIHKYVLIKYDTDGSQLWVVERNWPGGFYDFTGDMDDDGNISMAGAKDETDNDCNGVVVTHEPDGNEVSVVAISYCGADANITGVMTDDTAQAIAVDGDGNVYVTGESYGHAFYIDSNSNFSFETIAQQVTVKYDSAGNEVSVMSRDLSDTEFIDEDDNIYDYDYIEFIGIDSNSSTYVTGSYFVMSIDCEYGDCEYGCEEELDPHEARENDSNPIYVTISYDANGNEAWAVEYEYKCIDRYILEDIAISSDGYIYATGYIAIEDPFRNNDYVTVKYARIDSEHLPSRHPDYVHAGDEIWRIRYDSSIPDERPFEDYARAIAIDDANNVYVTGTSTSEESEYPYIYYDYATIKYSQGDVCGAEIDGDFNNDCEVGLDDLEIMVVNWLGGGL